MSQPVDRFINRILCGDACQILSRLPEESVDCVVTSPPYWLLRDYGMKSQLGREGGFQEYIGNLCDVFDQVQRVLKESGTCWVNLGDTYSPGSGTGWRGLVDTQQVKNSQSARSTDQVAACLPRKCLLQIPSRFAIEMTKRGWILRNEIIWWKPNAMPSSVKDRFTVDFEKIFFFVKSQRYFFTQQFDAVQDKNRLARRLVNPTGKRKWKSAQGRVNTINPKTAEASRKRILDKGLNKRCVWPIATRPFADEHFAVYPPALIETPIKAGSPEGGIVLDPFIGSGTTALVARQLGRSFIGIELNPVYVKMAQKRLSQQVLF